MCLDPMARSLGFGYDSCDSFVLSGPTFAGCELRLLVGDAEEQRDGPEEVFRVGGRALREGTASGPDTPEAGRARLGGSITTRPASRLRLDWRTCSGTCRSRRRQFLPLMSLRWTATGVGGERHSRALLDRAVALRKYPFANRSARRGTGIVRGRLPSLLSRGNNLNRGADWGRLGI